MDYQAADTYYIRTVEPERRDQKLCEVSPVSAAGASLRALVGRDSVATKAWTLARLGGVLVVGGGGHEVKTKESLNQASLKDNSRRLRRNQQAVMDKNQRPRLDPTE